ncbi:hypothetical protein LCGC14_0420880 [marine sediment metagenome]|uniref:Uncharacterized protein n=1 Tax=marine sediment metagenome TaxID=412755 RepID=A0A0F9VCT1_9ZZZZ
MIMSKVQYNPSTLKVSYNAATNKVQIIECPVGSITLTFSSVVECSPCKEYPPDSSEFHCWPSDLNTTFVLTGGITGPGGCLCWGKFQDSWCIGVCCYNVGANMGKLEIVAAYDGYDVDNGGIGFYANNVGGDASSANNQLVSSDCLDLSSVAIGTIECVDESTCESALGTGTWIAGYDGSVSISFS